MAWISGAAKSLRIGGVPSGILPGQAFEGAFTTFLPVRSVDGCDEVAEVVLAMGLLNAVLDRVSLSRPVTRGATPDLPKIKHGPAGMVESYRFLAFHSVCSVGCLSARLCRCATDCPSRSTRCLAGIPVSAGGQTPPEADSWWRGRLGLGLPVQARMNKAGRLGMKR